MNNIHYRGKFTDESQIKRDEPPASAVKFEEPDTFAQIFLSGFLVSLPLIILSTILLYIKMGSLLEIPFVEFLLVIFLNVPLLFVHELIHALSFPKNIETEIWTNFKEGALFVTFYEPISKLRFIMMSLAPNIVLGFLPFILYLFGVFDFNNSLANIVGMTAWLMILSGIGDYLNVFNAIRQVPNDAVIFNYGIHSYWIKGETRE